MTRRTIHLWFDFWPWRWG